MKKRVFLETNDAIRAVNCGRDAHAIRQFNFMNKEQPASVRGLLQDLGFGLEFNVLPRNISARLVPDTWPLKGFTVEVNLLHSRMRQRFSALHEVGHYYVHPHQLDQIASSPHRAMGSSLDDHVYSHEEEIEESEANQWADSVIFGNGALAGAVVMFGKDLRRLSKHFGFSEAVVKRAIERRNF